MASFAERPDPVRTFIQLWAESLSLVLGQIANVPFPMMPGETSAERPPAAETDVFLAVTVAGRRRAK